MNSEKRSKLKREIEALKIDIIAIECNETISEARREQDIYNCELRIEVIQKRLEA